MKKIMIMALVGIMTIAMLAGCSNPSDGASAPNNDNTLSEQPNTNPEVSPETSPSLDALPPQIAIFGGNSYLVTINDASITSDMLGDKIGDSSAFIDFSTSFDEALLSKELANSISENAVFYKMNGFSENLRIVAEVDGTYYILENTAISSADILSYSDLISGGTVLSGSGVTEIAEVTADDTKKLVEIFANTTVAELSNEDYENIAGAHTDGKAYTLNLDLTDGTSVSLYLIPELNLVSIGQTYHTSETLGTDISFVFEGLASGADGIVQ